MSFSMRLFKKRGWYQIEIKRNHSISLHTKDEEKAKSLYAEIEEEKLRGRIAQLEGVSRIKLETFKEKYLAYRESLNDLSGETIKKDALSLRRLIFALGKSTLLESLPKKKDEENKFEKFKSILLAGGASKITINGYLRQLKPAFRWAVTEGYISKLPEIALYKRLKKPEEEMLDRILEPEEIDALLAKAYERSDTWGIYCTVVLWTGGRRREALNLEWHKIDFKNGRITLKGKTGSRTIPMLKPVKKILEPIKKDIGPVFPDWHPDTVSHWFQKAAIDAQVPDHRLHDLRHTCATYLLKNGVSLDIVQRIMGHAQISTTQIYAQILDDILKAEMAKLRFR
jgi:integrase